MGDADKDFRYMALTDLMSELQKESLSLDSDTEEKVSIYRSFEYSTKSD
jgi:hypothetical protein